MEEYSNESGNQLLEFLQSIGTIKTQQNIQSLRVYIEKYLEYMPGPLTPQKYIKLDQDIRIDSVLYGKILENIIEKFGDNWPLSKESLDPIIKKLFIIDGCNSEIFHESILNLTNALRENEDSSIISSISYILGELLKSDAFYSSIIYSCQNHEESLTEIVRENEEQTWEKIVQLLISLPNRVANKAKRETPDSLLTENYVKILTYHLTRAISFLNDGLHFEIHINYKMLSILMSKIFLLMNSNHLIPLIEILSGWCLEDKNNIRAFIQSVLEKMERRSVEILVVLSLKNCNFNSKVNALFGDLGNTPIWKYILTTRIPLMSWYDDDNLIRNLMSYLNYLPREGLLSELLLKLLEIWGDSSAINHTPLEQHIYITKLIILSMKYLKSHLTTEERKKIKHSINNGIPAHLSCTNNLVLAIGMITGEIIIEMMNEEDAPKLQFDYETMHDDAKSLVKLLREFDINSQTEADIENLNELLLLDNIEFSSIAARRIYELAVEVKIIDQPMRLKSNESNALPDPSDDSKKVEGESRESAEELDSDDDLIPYDMSNDNKLTEMSRPVYLRDLRDNLVDSKRYNDPVIFSESLKVAEQLILSQLPNDDVSFGLELLDIFLMLRENCYVEDFDKLTFEASVAIVTVFPKECAEHLCREFYSSADNHSLQERVNYLEILAESARKLSRIEMPSETVIELPKKRKYSDKPISLCIEQKMGKYYETLYDDDFQVSKSNNSVDNYDDIIRKRIELKTRRFAHKMKEPKRVFNKFSNVATSFFYPLLYGFYREEFYVYKVPQRFSDQDNLLLVSFLRTLATIIIAAENCLMITRMGKDVMEVVLVLRYHKEAKVRLGAIENIAAVVSTIPRESLVNELFEIFMEVRLWLLDVSQKVVAGEPDSPIGLNPVTNVLTPMTSKSNSQTTCSSTTNIGSTWAGVGLNIDLDNIMGGKSNRNAPAPTMNELANNSPQHDFNSSSMGAMSTMGCISATMKHPQQQNTTFSSAFQ